jgi:hypothetical protein
LAEERSSNVYDRPDVGVIGQKRFVEFFVDRLPGLALEAVRNVPTCCTGLSLHKT